MQNSYRIRTEIGQDKVVNFQLDQNIEFLEILSFKIRQSDVYTLDCANYGVVAGRITANNGFGISNARVSIFIPLSEEDENNELITSIYPYKSINDKNEDGYRYNLLPYEPSYPGHIATGTFPSLNDVMFDGQAIEVYEKYYKYTVKTNSSGDYMIFGVPVGSYTILMDLDLSDIGDFPLTPQDLIRMGRATEAQFKGNSFQKSSDLNSLPQIVSLSKGITISPLWGNPETCDSTINRVDFDLRDDANIDIQPTSIFIGSIFGTSNIDSVRINCQVKESMGNLCQLETGPGQILAIRQTKNLDANGLPILEQYELGNNGRVIDGDGAWVVELPMNLDYVITDENGNQVITNDEKIGIPTKGKYRFKVKWQDVDNSTDTSRKAHFLVPNIKEYGWNALGTNDPIYSNIANTKKELAGSYYFGLDWDGYTNKDAAIICEDTFYEFEYNKVYTVAGLVDQYQGGESQGKFIGIKEISDRSCEQNVNKYPVNDGVKNFDLLYFLFSVVVQLFQYLYIPLIFGYHLIAFLWNYLAIVVIPTIITLAGFQVANYIADVKRAYTITMALFSAGVIPTLPTFASFLLAQNIIDNAKAVLLSAFVIYLTINFGKLIKRKIKKIHLPNITYPNCEFCDCEMGEVDVDIEGQSNNNGQLTKLSDSSFYFSNLLNTFNWTQFKDISGIVDDTKYEEDKPIILQMIAQVIAGKSESNGTKLGESDKKMPRSDENKLSRIDKKISMYSETLPIGERINYYNLRETYFSGTNKIKVSFANDMNTNKFQYHFDNTIVVLSDIEIETGNLLTFVSRELSKDNNFRVSGTTTDGDVVFGVPGTSKISTSNSNIQVKYATAQDTELELTYTLPTIEDIPNTSYYASDIEYYQVITGLTYSSYINLSNKNNIGYLPSILSSPTLIRVKDGSFLGIGNYGKELIINNPIQYFDGIENKYVLILQRGVDPYSPKYSNQYGLGKIFGYTNEDDITLTIKSRLNIPIQKLNNFQNPTNYPYNLTVQTLTNQNDVLFDSYVFQPGDKFEPYSTDSLAYYSGIFSEKNISFGFSVAGVLVGKLITYINKWIGAQPFLAEDNFFIVNGKRAGGADFPDKTPNNLLDSKYNRSTLDFNGGTYMFGRGNVKPKNKIGEKDYMFYYSYSSHILFKEKKLNHSNKNKIILRTDRLPTSDGLDGSSWLSNGIGALQQNNNFNIYSYSDTVLGESNPIYNNSNFEQTITGIDLSKLPNSDSVLESFGVCPNLKPLECYVNGPNGELLISDNCKSKKRQDVFIKNGCYELVRRPILDLVNDYKSFREWIIRLKLNYGLCQGIASETFVNNWVNGSLFMFSFRANTSKTNPEYCKDLVYYDKDTNNFYYRSSPYDNTKFKFVGNNNNTKDSESRLNNYNLMYPTTIVNLGVKNRQEASFNDFSNYGYVVNSINTTSQYDNSDLINLFVISRILDSNFLKNLINGNSVINSFFSRTGYKIDGDLAQLLSINSEFGVVKFSPELYEFKEDNSPTIIFSENSVNGKNKNYIGVFYSSSQSDLQLKDHITPGRVNFRQGDTNTLVIENYGNKSQDVPFYSWNLDKTSRTIFGTEKNNWGTAQTDIKNKRYQSLERIKPNNPSSIKNYTTTDYFSDSSYDLSYNNDRGYIFAQKDGKYNKDDNNFTKSFIVGAPFHFYFGIKKGFSAMDKFKTKYLNE